MADDPHPNPPIQALTALGDPVRLAMMRQDGRRRSVTVRTDDLRARFPGLLTAVLGPAGGTGRPGESERRQVVAARGLRVGRHACSKPRAEQRPS